MRSQFGNNNQMPNANLQNYANPQEINQYSVHYTNRNNQKF